LHKEGHSIKAIARQTGRSRNIVRRVLCQSVPATFPKPQRHSQLDAFKDYPHARTIHLVMDNLNSHTRKALVDRFGETEGGRLWNRLTVHYTPKHGSWLNQAEIAISLFSRQCLGRRRIADQACLCREAQAWNRRVNRDHVTIQWNFTRRLARKKFAYSISRSRR
jgi:transposase